MQNKSSLQLFDVFRKTTMRRGAMFGMIIIIALLAFELFNYSTTEFALTDLLGKDLAFMGMRWSVILSIAFCGIDFAGIARLFTPEQDAAREPAEVWYLFIAWVLAAGMNASLTWWGVAVAIQQNTALGSAIVGRETLFKVVPVFIAVMVWLIRLLIIGTFSMAGDRLFANPGTRPSVQSAQYRPNGVNRPYNQTVAASARPFQKPAQQSSIPRPFRQEPTYQPVGMTASSREDESGTWR